jgi:hypothetical protein
MTPSSAALLPPHLTMDLFAVETDKPSKTHRCSGRSRLTTEGSIPDTGPSAGCCLPFEKQQSIGHGHDVPVRRLGSYVNTAAALGAQLEAEAANNAFEADDAPGRS